MVKPPIVPAFLKPVLGVRKRGEQNCRVVGVPLLNTLKINLGKYIDVLKGLGAMERIEIPTSIHLGKSLVLG